MKWIKMKIPIAYPESQLEIKTGKWSIRKPIVDEKKCIKCAICQKACPEGIMGKEKEIPDIDLEYCKGCSVCANVCPVKAISMEKK